MELRSFLAGIFFIVGVELLLPLMGVKWTVTIPYQPASNFIIAAICLIIAYYLFRGN